MPPSSPAAPAASAAAAWIGVWSRPPDRPAQIALAVAGVLLALALVPGGPRWLATVLDFASLVDLGRKRRFLTIGAFVAAFLSLGYVAFYLRGGPRAAEAATYWLQGRAMAHGELAWTVPDPSASFRAHDLLFSAPDRQSGIFPPGYPLLLAPAFLVGAPMLVGPLVAAVLVIVTWLLAREVALAAGQPEERAESIGRVAVGLSILSVALRYHTAEALPHGATAVAVAAALACALRARRTDEPRLFGVTGLAVGFLLATHPVSAVTTGAVVAALAAGARGRARALGWMLAAAVPGAALLLAANHAAIGRAFASPASAYLASFDPHAPAGLHASVVAVLRRLRVHMLDVANFEPLALLALVPLLRSRDGGRESERRSPALLLGLVVAGQLLLAAPLVTTSVSQGAGARLLVAVIPLEHVLIALALARLFSRRLAPAAMVTYALALAGFAVHAANDHEALAASDLGRPHYEPDVAREANVTHGLLFFDDDPGFELACDPGVPASHGIQAVRMRGDDHDRLLYDSLGHPAIHRYVATGSTASVTYWSPPSGASDSWRFESESDWPPIAAHGGQAEVIETTTASEGHALALEPTGGGDGDGDATLTIALPVPRGPTPPERKTWMVTPRVLQRGGAGSGTLVLVTALGGPPLAQWSWDDATAAKPPVATELPAQPVDLGGDRPRAWLVLRAHGGSVALDKTTLHAR
jgi:hypothetical protein